MRTQMKTPLVAMFLSVLCFGCGQAEIATLDASVAPDVANTNDVTGTTDNDGQGEGKDGGESGASCLSNTDCNDTKGQTPCRVAKCVGAKLASKEMGKCELSAHPENTPCVDSTLAVSECTEQLCDVAGECLAKPRPKTAGCADQNLIASECQQKRCNGAGTCALANLEDGTGCQGAFQCGTVCAAGKCKVQTAEDYDDDNPCTNDYCDKGIKINHDPIDDLTVTCDDGKACTGEEHCAKGECAGTKLTCNDGHTCTADTCDDKTGCVNTPDDKLCDDDGNPCTVLGCDKEKGCGAKSFNKGAKCDDGDKCTPTDACDKKGACLGGASECSCDADKDCEEGNLCLPKKCEKKKCVIDQAAFEKVKCDNSNDTPCGAAVCDPKTGQCAVAAKNDKKSCDDNNVCTDKSACNEGVCVGDVTTKCDDKNPCTADSCDALKGCTAAPAEGACDDGSKCTSGDACVNGGCTGTAKSCEDGVPCTIDSCDETGNCAHTAKNSKCQDNNPCTTDTCDAAKNGCTYPANNKAQCDDNNPCTTTACQKGVCAVTKVDPKIKGCGCKTASECKDDNNECTKQLCTDGSCVYSAKGADGAVCDDGDKCNVAKSGKCNAGKCAAGKPKDCSSKAGKCTTAFCDSNSGECVVKSKADGSTCQDGSGCTENDKCAAGKCAPGKDVECKDKSACVATICKSKSATTHECTVQNKTKGEGCDDGKFCTEGETCDGAGKCATGKAKDCSGVGDACNTGTCNDTTKACVKKPKSAGTACDDGNFCKIKDKCDAAGKCVGGKARVCPSDAAKCKVGSCNATVSKCQLLNAKTGATCNDGNACTLTDTCASSGACKGSNTKTCKGTSCSTSACQAPGGTCVLKPKADKTSCSDGNACTTPDLCYTGSCKAGPVTCKCTNNAGCDDKNQCTIDKCTGTAPNTKCTNTVSTKLVCSDGNLCTTGDKCSLKGQCGGTKVPCNDNKSCTNDSCSAKTGKCVYVPNANSCSDGNACTVGDKCALGKCSAGKQTSCADATKCSSDKCDTKTGKCVYTAALPGYSCEKASSVCVQTSCACKLYLQYEGSTSFTNDYLLMDVVPSEYGGSIAVGRYTNGSYKYGTIQVRSASGGVTKRYNFSGSTSARLLNGATSYANTTFGAVGYWYAGSTKGNDPWFIQFDKNGTILKGKNKFMAYSSKDDRLYDVAYDSSYKQFWAVGTSASSGSTKGLIMRIDTSKTNGYSTAYQWGATSKYTRLSGVAYYGGHLYMAGYTSGGTLGSYDGVLLKYKLTSSNSLKLAAGPKYHGGTGSDNFNDIANIGNTFYAVGSTTTASNGSSDAWVVRFSSSSLGKYYENRYGGSQGDAYFRAAPWGSGIAAIGFTGHKTIKAKYNYTVMLDFLSTNTKRTKTYKIGSSSYVNFGYGIAYTGGNGGKSYAIVGHTSHYNRGLAVSASDAGKTDCGLKIPIGTKL